MKDFEKVLKTDHEQIIYLETRLSQVEIIVRYARKHNKKVFMHADLIQGLKPDEYGLEYLIHNVKVDGLVSTRANVIEFAKKHKVISIQRLFALDSHALERNLKMSKKFQPDYIEVLPGILPNVIKEIHEETKIPVIAGGLIRTEEDIQQALNSGAFAVTTSDRALW
ncbi:glycerol-3-phosphate responsive antiterminator [Bacillus mesophilus]|uniref:Glycerol-3-phosphate responsive antiterminator n=2 Tax=Bacillus mesophilus TaxID=1808955 RepID=A0A6M0QB39_9BACI|nr:glycerol-3-phosphate responsive antiterminator [Bacillus mesophilus]